VAAPQATMMGSPMISEPIEVAAAYLFYLCCNHAFVDGNKRVALATCLVFLSESGLLREEELDADAWETLTLAVAAGALSRDEVTAMLRKLVE
jgi:death-on-curing protein